jgi:hypothetical protein
MKGRKSSTKSAVKRMVERKSSTKSAVKSRIPFGRSKSTKKNTSRPQNSTGIRLKAYGNTVGVNTRSKSAYKPRKSRIHLRSPHLNSKGSRTTAKKGGRYDNLIKSAYKTSKSGTSSGEQKARKFVSRYSKKSKNSPGFDRKKDSEVNPFEIEEEISEILPEGTPTMRSIKSSFKDPLTPDPTSQQFFPEGKRHLAGEGNFKIKKDV